MKYGISFMGMGVQSDKFREGAVNLESKIYGFEKVNEIRKTLGKKIPLSVFDPYIAEDRHDYNIDVPENVATTLDCFKDTCSVQVPVKQGALNKYVKETPHIEYDCNSGEVCLVQIKRSLADDELIKSWADAGCPGIALSKSTEQQEDQAHSGGVIF